MLSGELRRRNTRKGEDETNSHHQEGKQHQLSIAEVAFGVFCVKVDATLTVHEGGHGSHGGCLT